MVSNEWYYFFASSGITFVFVILLTLIGKFLVIICLSDEEFNLRLGRRKNKINQETYAGIIKIWCTEIKAKKGQHGKLTNIFLFLFSIASYMIYTSDTQYGIESCLNFFNSSTRQIDFLLNVFFLFHFLIRYIAADKKLKNIVSLASLVDYLTIPPSFLTIFYDCRWIGFGFLRGLGVLLIPDVLQDLLIISSIYSVQTTFLVCLFVAIVITVPGVIFLAENLGDPLKFYNPNPITFFNSIYLIIASSSTTAYGDVVCETNTGKLFIMIFICVSIFGFAQYIPALLKLQGNRSSYQGKLTPNTERRHIVVCGYITCETITHFLRDFCSEDKFHDVEIYFYSRPPDVGLENVLKKYNTSVAYFYGSSLKANDLNRVRLKEADACLVLANKYSPDPDSEDANNIMSVISIKNHCHVIRIIIQLLSSRSKVFLCSIPHWDFDRGDDMIILSELKLGFIALSCLAPGFSTLLSNLISVRSFKTKYGIPPSTAEYLRGSLMNIYTVKFSTAFIEMKFSDAVLLCFNKLEILLIALQLPKLDDLPSKIIINPKNDIISQNSKGFFIADTFESVKRARIYCSLCHTTIKDVRLIKICKCTIDSTPMFVSNMGDICLDFYPQSHRRHQRVTFMASELPRFGTRILKLRRTPSKSTAKVLAGPLGTGLLLELHQNKRIRVKRHVLVKEARAGTRIPHTALGTKSKRKSDESQDSRRKSKPSKSISSERQSKIGQLKSKITREFQSAVSLKQYDIYDSTGMYHWRSASKLQDCLLENSKTDFTNHIIVCAITSTNANANSLIGLRNLILPLRSSNLYFHELKYIIIICPIEYIQHEWETIANFPKILIINDSPLNRAALRQSNIRSCCMCCILIGKIPDTTITFLSDKEAIMTSLNIKSMSFDDKIHDAESLVSTISAESILHKTIGSDIPLITELFNDSNVQYIDQDDDDDPDTELFLTQPFAGGRVFSISCLDAIISTVYFNHDVYNLIQSLVTGGDAHNLEAIYAESERSYFDIQILRRPFQARSRVGQIALNDPDYDKLTSFRNYGKYCDLFKTAYRSYGMICLGLFRYRDNLEEYTGCNKRYVITNPPKDFTLQPTDRVYVLQQFNIDQDRNLSLNLKVT